jgi:hypothetical protein
LVSWSCIHIFFLKVLLSLMVASFCIISHQLILFRILSDYCMYIGYVDEYNFEHAFNSFDLPFTVFEFVRICPF